MGLSLPGLALANQLYVAVEAQGFGRKGTHALMLALETLNGIKHAAAAAGAASSAAATAAAAAPAAAATASAPATAGAGTTA